MIILLQDSRGFTLIELMVAMLITLVGLVGLLQAVNVAMEHNMRNMLRDEAVLVGEQVMGYQKVRPFAQISTTNSAVTVNSRLRRGSLSYTVAPTSTALSTARQLIVTVSWRYKGVDYTHQVRSVRSE